MIRVLLARPRLGSAASAGRSRQVTAAESSQSWVMLAVLGVAGTVLLVAVLLGGKLAYLLTGRGWPDPGWWAGVLGIFTDPGDPTVGWPAVDAHPPAGVVWILTLTLAVGGWAAVAGGVVVMLSRRPRSAPGMATAAQEQWLTVPGLRDQAKAMRPQLAAQTHPRDLAPEQLGSYLGRSIVTEQPIHRPIEISSITCGLSGASKTMSVVVPAVLDWADRQVVSSTKADILRHTWQAAADRGGLRTFDPLGLSGGMFPSLRWTPIQGCDDPDMADARTAVLTDRGDGPDPHADFAADGRRVVRALLHAAGLADCDLRTLLGWVYNPLDKRPEQLIRSCGGHDQYADELAAVRATPDRQREGSYLSVRAAFDGMSTPRMLAILGHRPSESFDATHWTLHGRDSLYLLSHHKMPSWTRPASTHRPPRAAASTRRYRSSPTRRPTPADCRTGRPCWPTPAAGGSARTWSYRAATCSAAPSAGITVRPFGPRPGCGCWSAAEKAVPTPRTWPKPSATSRSPLSLATPVAACPRSAAAGNPTEPSPISATSPRGGGS
jgi:hypothetical protein